MNLTFSEVLSELDLATVGEDYKNEVNTNDLRRRVLSMLELNLKSLINIAKDLGKASQATGRVASLGNHDAAQTTGYGTYSIVNIGIPAPAPPRPMNYQGSPIAALIAFHEQEASKHQRAAEANAKVIEARRWLRLQQATLDPDGNIIWPKSDLKIVYDSEAQQQLTMITIKGGLLFTSQGSPLDTENMSTFFSGKGKAIYVVSREGNLHVHSHIVGHYHHSSLLAGAPVAGAGEIQVRQGKVIWISNKSGHYKPCYFDLLRTLLVLRQSNVELDFPIDHASSGKFERYKNFEAFVRLPVSLGKIPAERRRVAS